MHIQIHYARITTARPSFRGMDLFSLFVALALHCVGLVTYQQRRFVEFKVIM